MLFTCSLRCTDQVTSTHSRAKLSPCNRNPRLNCALYSDISLTSCTHTTSARKLLHFTSVCVCVQLKLILLQEEERWRFPQSTAAGQKWHLGKRAAASGGFSAQHGLMSYRCLLCAMALNFTEHIHATLWDTHDCDGSPL